MQIFDQKTIQDWKERNIREISLSVINKGCAGQKILVTEERNQFFIEQGSQDGITLWIDSEYKKFFEGARITHVGTKWIVASNEVNTRCGCGSSFSLKKSPLQDKIARTKLAIKEKKEGIHI
ncbi:hypothetical protein KBB25_02160 [Candidatus Gracilibacteria bacterium]|nr:hypothetical protein [Candidatus Gracilibacteria bacterium]